MERRRIIAVDFDGTLCEDVFPLIGSPKLATIRAVKTAKTRGCAIILWTCRIDDRLHEAIEWCTTHGLEFDAVNDNIPENIEEYGTNPRKVFADLYIDDKSCYGYEKIINTLHKWRLW